MYFETFLGFDGAWLQYLIKLSGICLVSKGSETFIALGKSKGKISVIPFCFNSLKFSYSFPLPRIAKFPPISFPNLIALMVFNLSPPASKILGKYLFSISASIDKSLVIEFPDSYQFASWCNCLIKAIDPMIDPG